MSATEPARLTPTQRLHEVTMAVLTRAAAPPEHSLELTRNAKGVVQFTVTVRGHDLDDVLESGRATYDKLNERYPYSVNGGGTE